MADKKENEKPVRKALISSTELEQEKKKVNKK